MIYVTNGYNTKKFDTEAQAYKFINEDITRNHLNFQQVYNHTENGVTVIIYQYQTLYFETYLIHKQMDLTSNLFEPTLEITAYEIHSYEITLTAVGETHTFNTEEDMLAFAQKHKDEPFTARRFDNPIFTEKE